MKVLKRFLMIIFALCLFVLPACGEEASVKVKFYDSMYTEENEPIIPGSHDIFDIIDTGLDKYVPTKQGYRFIKWTYDIEGTQDFVPQEYQGTEALLKVYAQWDELVKVVCYSGTEIKATYYYDDLKAGTPIADAQKNGYRFLGWYLDSTFENAFDIETSVFPSDAKTINIYAKFEIITTVIFKNGTNETRALLHELRDGTSTVPQASKEGYFFDGWYLDSNFQRPFDPSTYVSSSNSLEVYPKFTAKPKVLYYVDNTLYQSYYLESPTTVADPYKEGFTFLGWVNEQGEPFVVNTNTRDNQVARAKFEERVKVNFYVDNTLLTWSYLDTLTNNSLPQATKATYTFLGWYLGSSVFRPESLQTSEKSVRVDAKFEKITTIVFVNGTTEVSILLSSLKAGTAQVPTFTKEGFVFDRWEYADHTTFVYQGLVTDLDEIRVYAVWDERIKVNYYSDGRIYDSQYLEDITATYVPTEPTKEGYFFGGWYDVTLTTPFVLNMSSTSSLEAYAKWYQNPTVTNLKSKFTTEGTLITWDDALDTVWTLTIDGGTPIKVATNSYLLPLNLEVGVHEVSVYATFMEHDSIPASVNAISRINFTLTNVSFDKVTRKITWDAYEGASKYEIKFGSSSTVITVLTNEYVVPSTVFAGDYNFAVSAFVEIDGQVIGSLSEATTVVNVKSVERETADGLIINENDEYVLLIGVSHSFGGITFKESEYYDLAADAKSFVIKASAANTSFDLTTTDDRSIRVHAVNYITSISTGSNLTYHKTEKDPSNRNSETNKTGFMDLTQMYEIGNDDEEFYFDFDIDGTGANITGYIFDIVGNVGGDTDVNKYLRFIPNDGKLYLGWTDDGKALEEGTIVSLSFKPHYVSNAQKVGVIPSLSFTFKVNHGVNAYGFADLKEKISDTGNLTVNMHQNVIITNNDVIGLWGGADEINNLRGSLIYRAAGANDNFRLNGNYFRIDASQLDKATYPSYDTLPSGYKLYGMWQAILAVECVTPTLTTVNVDGVDYNVIVNSDAEFSNLEILGNATLGMSLESQDSAEKKVAELLWQSGCIDGIDTAQVCDKYTNVVISHCNEASQPTSLNRNSYDGVPRYVLKNTHTYELCTMSDSWSTSIGFWSDGRLVIKDSHIYNSSGIGINIGDPGNDSAGIYLGESTHLVAKDDELGYYLCNFPEVVFDNTDVDNWVYGSEEYFTAYGLGAFIPGYKVQLNDNISALTWGDYTLIDQDDKGFTKINMVMQSNPTDTLKAIDVTYVQNNGERVTQRVRCQEVGGTYVPVHPLAQSSPYTVLFPLGEYSDGTNTLMLMNEMTTQFQAYGAYYQGIYGWDDIKDSISILLSAWGEQALQTKAVNPLDENVQQATLYRFAVARADELKNNAIFMEVTMPTIMPGSEGVLTILLECKRVTEE